MTRWYRDSVIVRLPYGSDYLAFDLRGLKVRPLQPLAPQGSRDLGRMLSRAVDYPVDGEGLRNLAAKCRTAVIVVPDATRRASLSGVLPVILSRCLAAGIRADCITVLVACGTHPPAPRGEVATLLGELPLGVRIRQHSSREIAALVEVGEIRPGLPLHLDREAVETDLLVTVGAVRHHYYAGFGGGPKMVFPGIAGHDEIQANHSLVLHRTDDRLERHPGCEPGILLGNPVWEEIAGAADLRPPDFAVCLVPGRNGGIAWVGAGSWRKAFTLAVERVREWYELPPGHFQHIVACGGGRPGDSTLIQAHKGLDAACRFAVPGAEVVFAAELESGPGSPAMEPFLADGHQASILDRLDERYVQYGHTLLRILEKTEQHRVFLKSSLDRETAIRLGFIPVNDLAEVADRWREEGVHEPIAVMAEAHVWPRSAR